MCRKDWAYTGSITGRYKLTSAEKEILPMVKLLAYNAAQYLVKYKFPHVMEKIIFFHDQILFMLVSSHGNGN